MGHQLVLLLPLFNFIPPPTLSWFPSPYTAPSHNFLFSIKGLSSLSHFILHVSVTASESVIYTCLSWCNCMIIIIITTTNKIIWLVIHGDRQKLSLELGTSENLWWKNNFKQMFFQFFTKDFYSFRRFNRNNLIITYTL